MNITSGLVDDRIEVLRQLGARQSGLSLPQRFYNDPAFHRIDSDVMFRGHWILAGFECEIPKQGQYFTLQIGKDSVVVVRGPAGSVHAFFNACRHRGSKICLHERGQMAKLVCPYHQWAYNLDGTLLRAPGMHEGLETADTRLTPVHIAVLGGVIFICLAQDAPDFSAHSAAVRPYLESHRLGEARVAHSADIVVKANWKLVEENARECYHCPARHPELMRTFKNDFTRAAPHDNPVIADFWRRCGEAGIRAGLDEGEDYRISRIPFTGGALSTTMDGRPAVSRPLATLPLADVGQLRWHHYPSMFGHVYGDHAMFYRLLPLDTTETVVRATWLVHRDAEEGRDYELANLVKVWNDTNHQDAVLCENNQQGVDTAGYRPGPYNRVHETDVIKFVDWYCGTMERHLTSRTARADV